VRPRTAAFPIVAMASAIAVLSLSRCGAKGSDNDDTTPKPYTCTGTPATCLRLGAGWTYEGVVLTQAQSGNGGADPWVLRLDDGRYRLYYAVAIDEPNAWWGIVSWISDDGLLFTQESGYRLEGYTIFQPCIVRNPDGSYRMYWLDQKQGWVNGIANKAIKSALSTDGGWTFTEEAGERIRYSGTGYEANGIVSCRVLLPTAGGFRMYYHAISDHDRILSATSPDGLTFTREDGIRLDRLCPPETRFGGVTPVTDALGAVHIFAQTVRCTGDYVNPFAGLFDGTTTDGLTIAVPSTPFVRDYSKDGTLTNQVGPEDFTVVQTPQGLRVYFILYNAGKIIPETALYSIINTSIK
jgi:hypothetical protein